MKILTIFILAVSIFLQNKVIAKEEISLNGKWELVFDKHDIGEKKEWFLNKNFSPLEKMSIDVPSSWEEYIKNYEGVAWYGKTFILSEEYKGKTIRLHFDAVNYVAEVYLNGEPIGFHEGGYDPFEFRVDDLLKFDQENNLILRVVSPIIINDTLKVDGMTKWEAPHWRGALMAGIWQDVKLLINRDIYTSDIFIETRIDGSLKFNTEIINTNIKSESIDISYVVREKKSEAIVWEDAKKILVEPGKNNFVNNAKIDQPKLWSPQTPSLYTLEISINDNETKQQKFGIREFISKQDGLYLNGEKFYMKAGFWEGLYPNKLGAPDSREMVEKEIRLAKEAGLNTLRPWRKPPVPMILDLADEMGMCLFGCPAIECMNEKPKAVPQMMERIKNEVTGMVERDRNHPSIIVWELFNEIVRNPLARIKHETVLLTRSLDPTRAIIDESGGWANGARIYNPNSKEAVSFNEIHSYSKSPVNQDIYEDYRHIGDEDYEENWRKTGRSLIIPGAVTIVSEIGYGGFPDLESVMTNFKEKGNELTPTYYSHNQLYSTLKYIMEPSGLQDIFGSVKELCLASQKIQAAGNKLQIEAARINPKIHGYCVHAYTAGDWIIGAGVLDIWRTPKQFYHTLVEVNKPLYFSTRIEPANLYVGQEGTIKVNAVNEYDGRKGKVMISLKNSQGKTFFTKNVEHEAVQGISSVLEQKVTIPEKINGKCTLEVKFMEDGKTSYTNFYNFNVFAHHTVKTKSAIVAIDYDNKIKPFLKANNIPFSEELKDESNMLILTSANDLKNAVQIEEFKKVFEQVKKGATLCFLDPPAYKGFFQEWTRNFEVPKTTENKFYTENVMPFKLVTKKAMGRWDPVNHAASDHPYFKGLPTSEFMGQVYQNVSANESFVGLEQKPIASTVGWDYRRDHWGIISAWWGGDLAEIPYGKGKVVISTMQIMDYLGKDPVADIIMSNIISNN